MSTLAPIVDYTTLQAAVADTINRADLAVQIPAWIQLVEKDFNMWCRAPEQWTSTTLTVPPNTDYVSIPTGVAAPESVRSLTVSQKLTYVGSDEFFDFQDQSPTGNPKWVTTLGTSLHILPAAGAIQYQFTFNYWANIPALSTAVGGTNWLLQLNEAGYFYGTLMHAAPYLKEDERIPIWVAAKEAFKADLLVRNERERFTSGRLAAKRKTFGESYVNRWVSP
jgi:hypothetical protein